MDLFGESEELDFEADRVEDVLSIDDDDEDALPIDEDADNDIFLDDENEPGSDPENPDVRGNGNQGGVGFGVGATKTAGKERQQERNFGVESRALSENGSKQDGEGQVQVGQGIVKDNANALGATSGPEPIKMTADDTTSDSDEEEEGEDILSKISPDELHSITRTVVVNQEQPKPVKMETNTSEDTAGAGTTRPSATSRSSSSESEHNTNTNDNKPESEENRADQKEGEKEMEKPQADYPSRGFTIRKRGLPRSTGSTSPSPSLSPPAAKKPNPFLDDVENEPDPKYPRSFPPEVIDVIDEDSDDDDEEVEIIGENWKRGQRPREKQGIGYGADPRVLFGTLGSSTMPQNMGFVTRNPPGRGRALQVYDEDGFLVNSDEDADADLENSISRVAWRRRDNGNALQALRRTQANAIQARKASHKPCSLKQKLIAFNNNGNGNGTRNVDANGNGLAGGNVKKSLRGMVEAMSNGVYTEATIPASVRKYWNQRYDLFSRFDHGIRLDEESWYSVTPEDIAVTIAQRCQTEGVIIDAFCGCGGNTIQFATYCKKVVAIDIDPKKIEMAMHNAKIYGVEHKIDFVVADFMAIAPVLKADLIFLSPPWGGPGYEQAAEFDLKTMIPMDGIKLFHLAQQVSQNIAYFVPKNTNLDQLLELALSTRTGVDIQENFLHGRIKTITAYFGDLADKTRIREIANKAGPGAGGMGLSRRIPGGPTQLRHAKEGSPELATMIF